MDLSAHHARHSLVSCLRCGDPLYKPFGMAFHVKALRK